MLVTKIEDGLVLQLENESSLEEILQSDDMFFNDLYFNVDTSGCLWIFDYNKDLAYELTNTFYPEEWKDYYFFKCLLKGNKFKLIPYGSIEEVNEYFEE